MIGASLPFFATVRRRDRKGALGVVLGGRHVLARPARCTATDCCRSVNSVRIIGRLERNSLVGVPVCLRERERAAGFDGDVSVAARSADRYLNAARRLRLELHPERRRSTFRHSHVVRTRHELTVIVVLGGRHVLARPARCTATDRCRSVHGIRVFSSGQCHGLIRIPVTCGEDQAAA